MVGEMFGANQCGYWLQVKLVARRSVVKLWKIKELLEIVKDQKTIMISKFDGTLNPSAQTHAGVQKQSPTK